MRCIVCGDLLTLKEVCVHHNMCNECALDAEIDLDDDEEGWDLTRDGGEDHSYEDDIPADEFVPDSDNQGD